MQRSFFKASLLLAASILAPSATALAGQAPGAASASDIPMSHRDRVYAAEQFSNTVSVTDPVDNKLLGVIRLGDPQPGNFNPLYKGQVLVHGLGFSPDHHTLAVVSIGSNSVTFVDTATNTVKHVTYVGRSPHEAFFTPDGKEVWVTVRGENYISVLDAKSFAEKTRIVTPNGPGMQIFSPDGKYGYICSSFSPETDVVSVADHSIVARVKQESPFCPNIAATPDGEQVWFTLKDIGKTQVFNARPPFTLIRTIDTGAITNHVNFARTAKGTFAYVTVGGRNEVRVFRTDDFSRSPRSPWASCRTASGRPVTALASTSVWKTMMRWPRSTLQPTRWSPTFRSVRLRKPSPSARCRRPGRPRKFAAPRCCRPNRPAVARLEVCRCISKATDQYFAIRSGAHPGSAGFGNRPRTKAALHPRARARGRRRRGVATACSVHDEPGWQRHRQCSRSHSSDRSGFCQLRKALSCDRPGRTRRNSGRPYRFKPRDHAGPALPSRASGRSQP